ncbi:hypothetical protein J7I93_08765 [Bacillus sp. ISL-47]|uniref:hypothetical protein n=1 Tax=Bacillus sp. ISL-47 TaxID=2819130 RepID=UPI001BEAEA92|nr:hypothetical protein [Bacillus sp. ISL-47]MBT2688271.1 hypothetical protein [Bacillus sp. ISL-47]MBT2710064.1 hypothetical protein [Pseudomonas sp. ISL-84]
MKKFKVRFSFDHENSKTLEIEGESSEQLLNKLTSHSGWYIDSKAETAINMNLVTRISFAKPARASAVSGL